MNKDKKWYPYKRNHFKVSEYKHLFAGKIKDEKMILVKLEILKLERKTKSYFIS